MSETVIRKYIQPNQVLKLDYLLQETREEKVNNYKLRKFEKEIKSQSEDKINISRLKTKSNIFQTD